MKFTFLSDKYYNKYTNDLYPQLELKPTRPYAHVKVEAYGLDFYIPLRSNIGHPHAFFTDKKNRCGVDYSKAVIITDSSYIDNSRKVFIRKNEFAKLKGKDYKVKKDFEEYINLYIQAKNGEDIDHKDDILKYSSLQYFEKYLPIIQNVSNTNESKQQETTEQPKEQ